MKLILDANVIIAAFASHGLCESVYEICLNQCEIILCDDLLNEIKRNLPSKIKIPDNIVNQITELLSENAVWYQPLDLPENSCRDPDDVKILGLALSSNADFIITGDKDLLILEEFDFVKIITPKTILELSNQ